MPYESVYIKETTTGAIAGAAVTVVHLNQEPSAEWADTFAAATRQGVFGYTPRLEGDRLTLLSDGDKAHTARFAVRRSVGERPTESSQLPETHSVP